MSKSNTEAFLDYDVAHILTEVILTFVDSFSIFPCSDSDFELDFSPLAVRLSQRPRTSNPRKSSKSHK